MRMCMCESQIKGQSGPTFFFNFKLLYLSIALRALTTMCAIIENRQTESNFFDQSVEILV